MPTDICGVEWFLLIVLLHAYSHVRNEFQSALLFIISSHNRINKQIVSIESEGGKNEQNSDCRIKSSWFQIRESHISQQGESTARSPISRGQNRRTRSGARQSSPTGRSDPGGDDDA